MKVTKEICALVLVVSCIWSVGVAIPVLPGPDVFLPPDVSLLQLGAEPDCSLIQCAWPLCGEGQTIVYPEGKCCPACAAVTISVRAKPHFDCTLIQCSLPLCGEGQTIVYPEGQCCPSCAAVE